MINSVVLRAGKSSAKHGAPDFKYFVLKSQVLSMYRSTLRLTRSLPKADRDEIKCLIRDRIEQHRDEMNVDRIRSFISEFQAFARTLENSVYLSSS